MNKFKKPLELTVEEREKRAEDFVSFSSITSEPTLEPILEKGKKEPTKTLYLRIPQSYFNNIQEIASLIGLSMNSVCLELFRPAIKNLLRELKNK